MHSVRIDWHDSAISKSLINRVIAVCDIKMGFVIYVPRFAFLVRHIIMFFLILPEPSNSLFQSHWIGKEYYKRGPDGNEIQKTNVPHIRVEFRDTVWILTMMIDSHSLCFCFVSNLFPPCPLSLCLGLFHVIIYYHAFCPYYAYSPTL